MKNEDKTLKAIQAKFPDFAQEIERHYQTDENFRELCEDYLFCGNRIQIVDTVNPAEKSQQEKVFRSLMRELESELKNCLSRFRTST